MCYPRSIVWTHPVWLNDKKPNNQCATLQYSIKALRKKCLKAAEVKKESKKVHTGKRIHSSLPKVTHRKIASQFINHALTGYPLPLTTLLAGA